MPSPVVRWPSHSSRYCCDEWGTERLSEAWKRAWSCGGFRGEVEVELEAVVGQTHVRREDGVGGGVVEIVAHVGEEGSFGLELLDDLEGVFDVGVGWMRGMAEGVEDEDVKILELRKA